MRITFDLAIENTYEGGDTATTTAKVVAPPPPEDPGERDEWAFKHIYPRTGTGRVSGDSWYDATVTASSHPDLLPVGTTFDFGY